MLKGSSAFSLIIHWGCFVFLTVDSTLTRRSVTTVKRRSGRSGSATTSGNYGNWFPSSTTCPATKRYACVKRFIHTCDLLGVNYCVDFSILAIVKNGYTTFMVCSHCPTVRPIKNGLHRTQCSYCTETDTNTGSHCVLNSINSTEYLCRTVWTHHYRQGQWNTTSTTVVLFQTLVSMLEKSRDYVSFLQKKLDKYLLGQGDQALGK